MHHVKFATASFPKRFYRNYAEKRLFCRESICQPNLPILNKLECWVDTRQPHSGMTEVVYTVSLFKIVQLLIIESTPQTTNQTQPC